MRNDKPAGGSLSAFVSIMVLLSLLSAISASAATFSIINRDGAGEGFNDSSPPITPAPNNPGATLGAQRMNVFQAAAGRWGEILDSDVVIRIEAKFDAQFCTTNAAVLGSAGAIDSCPTRSGRHRRPTMAICTGQARTSAPAAVF
jgi:hypothetical protein